MGKEQDESTYAPFWIKHRTFLTPFPDAKVLARLFVFRTWNPLVANPRLLTDGEFAADYRELLRARLEGKTLLPELCGDAMRWAVSGFPN
jgi:hypothetical protein